MVDDIDILSDISNCDILQIMNDANFIDRLTHIRVTDRRKARRLLFGINSQQQRDATALSYNGCTVEHILPQSEKYWTGWKDFSELGPNLGDWVTRLGNLALLGRSSNYSRDRFNASFERKKRVFQDSPFAITKAIADHPHWSPSDIDKRSAQLAREAARVWRFSRQL